MTTSMDSYGLNLFAYCGNNPVNRCDPNGHFWSKIAEFLKNAVSEIGRSISGLVPAYAGLGGMAVADGPLPFGDIVAAAGAAVMTVGIVAGGIYKAATSVKSKAEEKEVAIPNPSMPTTIYRYYSSKTNNLSPRPGIDYDGLSFSTRPPRPGVSAVMTTVEQVNATMFLCAVQDPKNKTHYLILPTNGTINQWMDQGQSSIWTQALANIVIELGR